LALAAIRPNDDLRSALVVVIEYETAMMLDVPKRHVHSIPFELCVVAGGR
jgi:hypothetical protein